jgi:formate hydrogenlyase subunit 6/NADH:ubiquinone oxidoreductase subunit I
MKVSIIRELLGNLLKKPMTVRFPQESIPIAEGYRGEQQYDIDKCISCGLCARVCPNMAIRMVETPEEHRQKYPKTYPQIDLGKCCFCGLCQDISSTLIKQPTVGKP